MYMYRYYRLISTRILSLLCPYFPRPIETPLKSLGEGGEGGVGVKIFLPMKISRGMTNFLSNVTPSPARFNPHVIIPRKCISSVGLWQHP